MKSECQVSPLGFDISKILPWLLRGKKKQTIFSLNPHYLLAVNQKFTCCSAIVLRSLSASTKL